MLVRNLGYGETDQSSGYDLFFADEVKPDRYNQIWTNWERSDDKLTTTITFRNEYLYEPITLTASKEWVDGTTKAGHPSVTFYLLRSVNGEPFEKLEGSEKVIAKGAEGDALTVNWTLLPQKNEAGTEFYTYKIAEVDIDGFETEITGTAKDGYIVKNTDGRIDVPVLKVDKGDGTTPLSGAEFTLYKMKGTQYQKYLTEAFPESPYAAAPDCVFTSNGSGTLTITGLSDGDYWLDESKAPAGYITKGEKIYFSVANGMVTLTQGAGTASYEKVNATDTGKTLIIKNEPGAALPNTGGPGTNLIYLLGTILTALAGSGLVMRRKRKAA